MCWRAWYAVPRTYLFRPLSESKHGTKAWFDFKSSSILGLHRRKTVNHWGLHGNERAGSAADAETYLRQNYKEPTTQRLLDRLVNPQSNRGIVICTECTPHVENSALAEPREVRLCDYVVDPVCLRYSQALPAVATSTQDSNQAMSVAVERWHVHGHGDDNDAADMEDDAPRTTILSGVSADFTDA